MAGADVRVGGVVRMSLGAMRGARVSISDRVTATDVLLSRYWLKVSRVTAVSRATEMVQIQFIVDLANQHQVRDAMCSLGESVL